MANRLALGLLMLFVSTASMPQTGVTTDNTSKSIGNGRWEWTVFIKGDPDTLSKVRCVEYLLHPTFPDRDRKVCDRGSTPGQAYPLTATGWGTFTIPVTVFFSDRKPQSLTHTLRFDIPAVAAAPSPLGCKVANSFSMREHDIQVIGNDWPGVYLYAQEIHQEKPSHFYFIKSTKAVQPGSFNWPAYRRIKHPIRRTILSNPDTNAYVKVSASFGNAVSIPVRGPKTTLYVKDQQEHKSANVVLCK